MKKQKLLLVHFLVFMVLLVNSGVSSKAQTICGKWDQLQLLGNTYILQNDVWGASTSQCITYNGGTSFTVTSSSHNQNSVASYPSIKKGCDYGVCTSNSGMPIQVSKISSAPLSFSVGTNRPSGLYDVMTEAWFSSSTNSTNGYAGGCELLIGLDYIGGMGQAGSYVGSFNGYSIYYANIGWNFVQYVKWGQSSVNVNLLDFINDAVSRGYLNRSWYLHNVQGGFELCRGGAGLKCNSFSISVNTGGPVGNFSQTIQAENYSAMFGVQKETTTDAGGGQDVGWIDANDWMSYPAVNIPASGTYTVEYRVASLNGGGSLRFEEAGGSPLYGTISVPGTGGWQNWTTIKHTVSLTAGSHSFGINAATGGWNINWFAITQGVKSAGSESEDLSYNLVAFPSPAKEKITISGLPNSVNHLEIYDMTGKLWISKNINNAYSVDIDVSGLASGLYILNVLTSDNSFKSLKFSKE